jgi:transposase
MQLQRWQTSVTEVLMKRFIEGANRAQGAILPECLDDYISDDNPVRAIDAFVEALDLLSLGFEGVHPEATGRPSYHPSTLLRIYVYGYLNRIQSSRRLERETRRNLELLWLTGRLSPDFKTIADFRKDNGPAIQKVCARFIELCRELHLFSNAIVAIDGSKFKAVNNRDKNFTARKLEERKEQLETSVRRYLEEIDHADRRNDETTEARVPRLKEKIESIKQQLKRLAAIEKQLEIAPDKQISLTDPDARSMATSGRGTGIVGYNVQSAVDTKHHLIVAHEVTNVGHDRAQLASMAKKARAAMSADHITAVADRGYFNGEEIIECDRIGITALVPKPLTSGNKAQGLFDKRDFEYIEQDDEYQCPAGQRAIRRFSSIENGQKLNRYWSSACPKCHLRSTCTTGKYRRITRWEHEDVLERMQ